MEVCFDSKKYLELMRKLLLDRADQVAGNLYIALQGKLLKDDFASRILPGYEPDLKKKLIAQFKAEAAILVCINANTLIGNHLFTKKAIPCVQYLEFTLKRIETATGIKPQLVITNINMEDMYDIIFSIEAKFQKKGYRVWEKYQQKGYLSNKRILSEIGLGGDDHIPLQKKIIFVTGIGEEHESFRTCMSQLYLDQEIGIKSSFCMWQTLPIPELAAEDPIHQARSAKNPDKKLIQDEGICLEESTTSNFIFLKKVLGKYLPKDNLIHSYQQPSDMLLCPSWEALSNLPTAQQAAEKELAILSKHSS